MRIPAVAALVLVLACDEPRSPKIWQRQGDEFDRGGAAAALGNVDVSSCANSAGPSGTGHVRVTFGLDGTVIEAVLDKEYEPTKASADFNGTPRGECLLTKFRAIRVPAYDAGAPVKIGKTFTLQ